jgi:6-phosphogluconolactonase
MGTRHSLLSKLAVWLFLLSGFVSAQTNSKYFLYVGTFNARGSKGIYGYRFDSSNGKIEPLGLKAELANPSFLAIPSNRQFLYSVIEVDNFQGRHSGGLAAYRADAKTGDLTLLNQTSSIGEGPCHISFDATGKFLLAANYGSGSVAAFPILGDGKLGSVSGFVQHLGASVNRERQAGPHAHYFQTTADGRFAIAADLGLDQLVVYKFDSNRGTLTAAPTPHADARPGSGPRHYVFDPKQRYLYLVGEMDSAVTVFTYDSAQGTLQPKQTISALPKDYKGNSDAAEIQIDAKGKFLYVSTRGPDSIAVFRIHPESGELSQVETIPTGGKTPRYFSIDPSGKFLLVGNQESDTIVTFRISQKTGRLRKTAETKGVLSPVSFAFLKAE